MNNSLWHRREREPVPIPAEPPALPLDVRTHSGGDRG
jgi:hypothetical protein